MIAQLSTGRGAQLDRGARAEGGDLHRAAQRGASRRRTRHAADPGGLAGGPGRVLAECFIEAGVRLS